MKTPPIGKSMSKGALAFRVWRIKTSTSQLKAASILGYHRIPRIERGFGRPSLAVALRIKAMAGVEPDLWFVPLDRADKKTLAEVEEQIEERIRGSWRKHAAAPAAAPVAGRKRRRRPRASAVA